MAYYTATNGSTSGGGTQLTASSTYGAMITLGCSTTSLTRGKLYDVLVGTSGAPADNYMEFQICRVTTVSTGVAGGTTIVAPPLDSNDRAAISLAQVNSTGTPTVTVPNLWYIGMNQRASYRWVAAPGSELIWPATASNGVSLQTRSGAYTGNVTGTGMFVE